MSEIQNPQFHQIRFSNSDLYDVIEMFLEYRDVHGYSEENAKYAAVREIVEGRDAEQTLVADGVIPMSPEVEQIIKLNQ